MCRARYGFEDTQAECAESMEKNKRGNIRVSYDWMRVCFNPLKLSLLSKYGLAGTGLRHCRDIIFVYVLRFIGKRWSSLKLVWFPCVYFSGNERAT